MNLLDETKHIMKKYNLTANKKLGQNFLIDEDVVNKIVDSANVTKNDLVIEIGPGLGTLTEQLLEKAGKVVCIELDERMLEILSDRFSLYRNFELINKDVLKVDLYKLIEENKNEKLLSVKIVANLPYYITTPIIMKLLEDKLEIDSITVMVQKEVADRLTEKPGGQETGAITYAINYYTNPAKVVQVPNTSFIPSPEVNSTVIKLNILKEPNVKVKNASLMFKVIKAAFSQRRKTLLNSLSNSNMFGTKKQVEEALTKLGIDLRIRAEKLTLEDFAKISNSLTK